jgi:hypothetical protein
MMDSEEEKHAEYTRDFLERVKQREAVIEKSYRQHVLHEPPEDKPPTT